VLIGFSHQDGVCKKTIERQNGIQSIVWLPNSDGKIPDAFHVERFFMTGHDQLSFLSKEARLSSWCVKSSVFHGDLN